MQPSSCSLPPASLPTLVTRLPLDARLFTPAPPRKPRQNGRPRVVGKRLPTLEQIRDDPTTRLYGAKRAPLVWGAEPRRRNRLGDSRLVSYGQAPSAHPLGADPRSRRPLPDSSPASRLIGRQLRCRSCPGLSCEGLWKSPSMQCACHLGVETRGPVVAPGHPAHHARPPPGSFRL